MTVVVTGSTGFVGRAVVASLAREGHTLRLLSHSGARSPGNVRAEQGLLPSPDAEREAFRAALVGASAVIHCAALNNHRHSATAPEAFMAANGRLTARLAEAAAEVPGCGFIFLSSIRAVAGAGAAVVVGSDTPPDPRDAYGRSKRAGEQGVEAAFSGLRDRRAAILRLPMVYGPGMGGLLRLLLRLARSPLPLPLGAMPGARPLLGLDKAVEAVMLLLHAAPALLRTLVAADRQALGLGEIVTAFRQGLGRRPSVLPFPWKLASGVPALRPLLTEQAGDVSRLAALGWEPRMDPRTALAALAASETAT